MAAKYLCERSHLNRISERRAGTVRFDVADALDIYIGHGQCRGNSGGLSCDGGRGVADFISAIVIGGKTANDSVDLVAIGERRIISLQNDEARAVSTNGSTRQSVKGAAMAIRRFNPSLAREVATSLGNGNGAATGEGNIALIA